MNRFFLGCIGKGKAEEKEEKLYHDGYNNKRRVNPKIGVSIVFLEDEKQ
jgi:hypothetical protein